MEQTMDMIEQARERYDVASESGYQIDAELAQAAAKIAIAEQLKRIADALELQAAGATLPEPHGKLFKCAQDDRSTGPDWDAA